MCVPLCSTHTRARRVLGHRSHSSERGPREHGTAEMRKAAQAGRAGRRLGARRPRHRQERDSATSLLACRDGGAPTAYTWPMAVDLSCQ